MRPLSLHEIEFEIAKQKHPIDNILDRKLATAWSKTQINQAQTNPPIDEEIERLLPLLGRMPEGSTLASTIGKTLALHLLRHTRQHKHDFIADSLQLLYVKSIQAYNAGHPLSEINLALPALHLLDAAAHLEKPETFEDRVNTALAPHKPHNTPLTFLFPYRLEKLITTGVHHLKNGTPALYAFYDEIERRAELAARHPL